MSTISQLEQQRETDSFFILESFTMMLLQMHALPYSCCSMTAEHPDAIQMKTFKCK